MAYDREMDNAEEIIQMKEVHVVYPNGTRALRQCDLTVVKGEFLFIVGSSGSGKSTLIKTMLGEVHQRAGEVIVAGDNLGQISRRQLPFFRRKMGVVFQDFRLLNDRTVFENVALAQHVIGVDKERMQKSRQPIPKNCPEVKSSVLR